MGSLSLHQTTIWRKIRRRLMTRYGGGKNNFPPSFWDFPLGADSAVEYDAPLHQRRSGQVSSRRQRSRRSDGLRRRVLVHSNTEQTDGRKRGGDGEKEAENRHRNGRGSSKTVAQRRSRRSSKIQRTGGRGRSENEIFFKEVRILTILL